jgi:hypothetical protein
MNHAAALLLIGEELAGNLMWCEMANNGIAEAKAAIEAFASLVAALEGPLGMQVTKQVHVVIELNENEAYILRYFLTKVDETSLETLHPDFQRFRTNLLFQLPEPS